MARKSPARISTVVFDLDDTLFDCFRQRVLQAHRYACGAMLKAGLRRPRGRQPSAESLYRLRRELFRQNPELETLDLRLCHAIGLSGAAARRAAKTGQHAYFSFPVGPLHLFADTLPALRRLRASGVDVFILTAGVRRIQLAKVKRLGLDRSPAVRRILCTGVPGGRGKKKPLRSIARRAPSRMEVLVVGDRPDSEIRAANELGLWTVRRRGGEFARRPARSPEERADFTIRRLSQLFGLPFDFRGPD